MGAPLGVVRCSLGVVGRTLSCVDPVVDVGLIDRCTRDLLARDRARHLVGLRVRAESGQRESEGGEEVARVHDLGLSGLGTVG